MAMKLKLIAVGNSAGVILPRPNWRRGSPRTSGRPNDGFPSSGEQAMAGIAARGDRPVICAVGANKTEGEDR